MADKTVKNPRGAGRPKTGRKDFKTISISGETARIEKLQNQAAAENKTVSRYVLDNLVRE